MPGTPVAAAGAGQREPAGAEHPHIRSFCGRRGHFTAGQRSAYERLAPRFGLPFRDSPIDPAEVFGRSAPLALEIGFGMGESTARIAAARPDTDFIGVEVYPPGVGSLLRLIELEGLSNLRVIQHDAIDVVRTMIAPAALAAVHLFFPDPWPKARHHKRRLVRPDFIALLASRIRTGGYLHCATDWEDYAQQMLAVLSAEPLLANTAADFAPRPTYRPLTKFEARGLQRGYGVWDLVFSRPA